MARFPSREWVQEALQLLESDPERALASAGWEGDFGVVMDAEPGLLDKPFAVHVTPTPSGPWKFEVLEDPDELEALEPAYFGRAKYSVWKGLILGTVDPVEALLFRKLTLRGDLQQVAERSRFKGLAQRVLERLRLSLASDAG